MKPSDGTDGGPYSARGRVAEPDAARLGRQDTPAAPVDGATVGVAGTPAAPSSPAAAHWSRSAPVLMLAAAFLFATMGVCVKLASVQYSAGEITFYRGTIGALMIAALVQRRGGSLRTPVPLMHAWRSVVGVSALMGWFYAIAYLPLATAITLNYMSSIWIAMFLIGGSVMLGRERIDSRLIGTVLLGFAGVALVLRPTIAQDQLWAGLVGLLSGMLSAMAYLQVTSLGRVGEPEYRVVFYFSIGGALCGLVTMLWSGASDHSLIGVLLLLAVGVLATIAQLMMTRAYATGKTLVNASLQYLGIAWSFLYGVLIFDDPVTWMATAGIVLIVAAGLAATLLRSRSDRDLPPSPTNDS